MKRLTLALIACAFTIALADPTEKLDGVEDLDPETFDKFVNGGKAALVEFYAPWCGHCKHLTPEYKKLGELIKKDPKLSSRVVIAKVDADAHRPLGERFSVQGFPTIKWFSRGKPVAAPEDYNGARKAEDFLSFIQQQIEADKGFARVASLDSLAQQFRDAPDLSTLLTQLTDKVSLLTEETEKSAGDLYVKYGKKSIDKGYAWFQTEYDRLERMLENGKVSSSKTSEISRKLSVLGAFLEDKAAEAADAVS